MCSAQDNDRGLGFSPRPHSIGLPHRNQIDSLVSKGDSVAQSSVSLHFPAWKCQQAGGPSDSPRFPQTSVGLGAKEGLGK